MNCAGLDTAPEKPARTAQDGEGEAGRGSGLRDRVYLITGGSRGLGHAAAEALVAEGARVVVSARDAGATARAAAALGPGGRLAGRRQRRPGHPGPAGQRGLGEEFGSWTAP
jgi:hypothetical protein